MKLGNIQTRMQWLSFAIDIFMIILVILDLLWLMFDALFDVRYIREAFINFFPIVGNYYQDVIHPNFLFFDGFIVLIFMVEFGLRWIVAIVRRDHAKWFFYPIVRWYDLLGCIPNSSFRILRLFRIGLLIYKLHKWGVIDIEKYYLYKLFMKYYNIGVEEVADRVAVRILEETKEELERGRPLVDAILQDVIAPKRLAIVESITERVQTGLKAHYQQYRTLIHNYIEEIVRTSVEKNKEVAGLDKIPLFGGVIKDSLRSATCDIVFGVFDRLLRDFSDREQSYIIETIVDVVAQTILEYEANPDEPSLASEIVSETIELIIARVNVRQWKIDLEQERLGIKPST